MSIILIGKVYLGIRKICNVQEHYCINDLPVYIRNTFLYIFVYLIIFETFNTMLVMLMNENIYEILYKLKSIKFQSNIEHVEYTIYLKPF